MSPRLDVETNGMNRRELLCSLGAATGLAAIGLAKPAIGADRAALGIQFFTFNALASQGWQQFAAAMGTVRDLGYDDIQFAGLMGHAPKEVRRRADELGFPLRSIHIGNDQVRAFRAPGGSIGEAQDAAYTPRGIVQIARVNAPLARDLGCEWAMLAASGPTNMQTLDNVLRMCEAMNLANEIVRQAGLRLSYHPHAPDFAKLGEQTPFDVMLQQTDTSIRYELDVAWVVAGGADPVRIIKDHPKRVTSFHLKDLDSQRKARTPGDGAIDFAAIRTAARELEDPLFYVECDGAPADDPAREPRRAIEHLHSLGWGRRAR
jgi:sugar phosphate isomerase/epimerase